MGRYNVRSAADDLLYAADLARSRARANRVAYALQIGATGSDGEFLQLWLRRGVDPTCASAAAGSGEVVYQRDFHKNNTANDPEIVILARAPGELASAGLALCFKPDGRVVRADTELPFSGPGAGYLAGDVYYELSRVVGTTPIGDRLQVQIGYNGSLRLVFGRDLTKLQGGS
jgi:hypothetical protein